MIARLSLTNIACFPSLEMALEPLTVLVGPNAAGKSTVLRALELLARWHSGGFEPDAVRRIEVSRDASPQGDGETVETQEETRTYYRRDRLPTLGLPRLGARPWSVVGASGARTWSVARRQADLEVEQRDPLRRLLVSAHLDALGVGAREVDAGGLSPADPFWTQHLRYQPAPQEHPLAALYLQLDRRALAAPSALQVQAGPLEADGAGLASVLSTLLGTERDVVERIEADLAQIVPQVRRIRIAPARIRRVVRKPFTVGDQVVQVPSEEDIGGHRLELDLVGAGRVPAELLSEGTLIALGLLTALHHPNRPNLVLIDDLDRGLHLNAQVRVVRVIQHLQELNPQLQVIATTHSPFQLEGLQPEQIRVHAVRPDGTAAAARLADHPEIERWSKTFRTDELWANLGEDWVLEAGS